MPRVITEAEFEDLYRATAHDVFAYVRRRTGSEAEEIVAETYTVAWRRRADLPTPMLRRAWLFGVARTLLLAEVRRQHRERMVAFEAARSVSLPTSQQPDGGRGTEIVSAALARLPPAQRELLRLVTWEGLTPAELSVALGIRPGAARVRLHRARQALAADPQIRALIDQADLVQGEGRARANRISAAPRG